MEVHKLTATKRVVVIGSGAIGRPVAERLAQGAIDGFDLLGVLVRPASVSRVPGGQALDNLAAALELRPDLVVEAAGVEAFRQYVPDCLAAGVDVLAVSLAAMAEPMVERAVAAATAAGGGRLLVASGAIGALEAVSAAREAGLLAVTLVQRKPPRAFPGLTLSPDGETVVSAGSARDAALAFPRNANISAAIALAGIGFDATRVSVVADPRVDANIAELEASGDFGVLRLTIRNRPSDLNPSTARLAALSVVAALRRRAAPIIVPA